MGKGGNVLGGIALKVREVEVVVDHIWFLRVVIKLSRLEERWVRVSPQRCHRIMGHLDHILVVGGIDESREIKHFGVAEGHFEPDKNRL